MACRTQPTLRTHDGLVLRPWGEDDAKDVIAAFNDSQIRKWHMLEIKSQQEAIEWIQIRNQSWTSETGANWAVTEGVCGAIVGRVGLRDVRLRVGQAECNYWVLPHARGQGIAPRAVAEMSGWCLNDLGLHRLVVTHSVANTSSCKVALKAGYRYEGTMISQVKHADGWHNMHLHALLNRGQPLDGNSDLADAQ